MSDMLYKTVLMLYEEDHDYFYDLPRHVVDAFYTRLHSEYKARATKKDVESA